MKKLTIVTTKHVPLNDYEILVDPNDGGRVLIGFRPETYEKLLERVVALGHPTITVEQIAAVFVAAVCVRDQRVVKILHL